MNKLEKLVSSRTGVTITIMLVIDCLFYGLTNPARLDPALLFLGLLLLLLTLYPIFILFFKFLAKFKIFLKNSSRISAIISLLIVLLICLVSVGQLSFKDIFVLVLIGVIAYFYLEYLRPYRKNK